MTDLREQLDRVCRETGVDPLAVEFTYLADGWSCYVELIALTSKGRHRRHHHKISGNHGYRETPDEAATDAIEAVQFAREAGFAR